MVRGGAWRGHTYVLWSTQYATKDGLELVILFDFASLVVGLQVCAVPAGLCGAM